MPFDCCFSCPSFSLSLSLLAYLCDQRKWEDKIQDLKKKKVPTGLRKRRLLHRCHLTESLNIFPEMPFTCSCYRDIWSQASPVLLRHSFLQNVDLFLTIGTDIKLLIFSQRHRFEVVTLLTDLIHMEDVSCFC